MTNLDKAFEADGRAYLSPQYQEAEVRKDFIDKFFKALGWDVDHDEQKNPRAQEVKVERGQQQGAARKRADYAFFLAPNFLDVRFFVEAKKPSVQLENPDDCFQAIRYGWNSQNLVSVLTDFEQFLVLDCRYKPSIDNATLRIWKTFHYSEYRDKEKFADLYWLFSHEAVASGALDSDKLIPHLPKAKGKAVQRGLFKGGWQSIDDSFLEELDQHRDTLARAFKNKNPELDSETLTEITQRTINRLVFTRFLEDRLIEERYHIANYGEKSTAWKDFIADSRALDKIYNGIVFKYHPILDDPAFAPDDRSFAGICEGLAHINSPYDFNAIPIHILGSIYERFLGKVIIATDKRATVEEKPEVRKAGGVYYTPEYIVRYIVQNTVGKLIEGKTPNQIAEMRFADIACGSGSFLLGVYDCLMDYHEHWYNEHPEEAKNSLHRPAMHGARKGSGRKEEHGDVYEQDGAYHLTLRKRTEILLNNIYGVDIDHQAVEVAQLSLYLKLLENETAASRSDYQLEFHETLLPPLNKNIVCGNSLIGSDIFIGQLFEREEEKNLNPLDYQQRFPDVMRSGGFDAIIGNPPYVRMEEFKEIKAYLKTHYQSHEERADFYTYFIERGLSLLNPRGLFGMIVSNKFAVAKYGRPLRETLEHNALIKEITDFAGANVFKGATVRTFILLACKRLNSKKIKTRYIPVPKSDLFKQIEYGSLTVTDYANSAETYLAEGQLSSSPWELIAADISKLLKRLSNNFPSLTHYYGWRPLFGIKTGLNEAFVVDDATRLRLIEADEKSTNVIKPFLFGKDLKPYSIQNEKRYVIYLHPQKNPKDFPAIKQHLEKYRPELIKRASNQDWYELQQPAVSLLPLLKKPKIVYPIIAPEPRFALDTEGFLVNDKLFVLPSDSLYLLGLLNSSLARLFFSSICARLEGSGDCYYEYRAQFVERFPVPNLDLKIAHNKFLHDKMVNFVETITDSKRHLEKSLNDRDRDFYENKYRSLQAQIDSLVYELYGLTKEEIKIVEGEGK